MEVIRDRELHEECGVFGIYGVPNAASLTYYGLHALQHRGQEGAGIVSVDESGTFRRIKGGGLVTEVFDEAKLATLKGSTAIGHVRYTTAGGGGMENVQPFLFRHNTGDFALAHNGNIVNSELLRRHLENKGSLFQSTSDSEILAHLIKKETRYHDRPRIFSIIDALNMLEGAFAFLIMTANRIYACRDKYGLRPLSIGKLGDGWVVSSETCAFDVLGAEFVRDVEPGEIVTIDRQGIRSRDYSMYKRHEMCSMEYIYFARPDSDIDGCNVHAYRKESGRLLWKEAPAEADIVVGVPDSSLSAAMGYAEASGLPYEMGLIKNKYIGRTFIQPSQELREKGVRMKLSAVRSIVRGKRVVLVDHNERAQAVPGLDQAEILEIIDHHRLADIQTSQPIRVRNEPVGSTATIIAGMYQEHGVMPSANMAGLLAAAILADTVMFKSPTCTKRDIAMAERMARIGGVNIKELGRQLFSTAGGKSVEELVSSDFKEFHIGEQNLGVGQVTCLDSMEMLERKDEFLDVMRRLQEEHHYNMVILMLTDVLLEGTQLLYVGSDEAIRNAFSAEPKDNALFLPGVMSRKKQIIPMLSALWG